MTEYISINDDGTVILHRGRHSRSMIENMGSDGDIILGQIPDTAHKDKSDAEYLIGYINRRLNYANNKINLNR